MHGTYKHRPDCNTQVQKQNANASRTTEIDDMTVCAHAFSINRSGADIQSISQRRSATLIPTHLFVNNTLRMRCVCLWQARQGTELSAYACVCAHANVRCLLRVVSGCFYSFLFVCVYVRVSVCLSDLNACAQFLFP